MDQKSTLPKLIAIVAGVSALFFIANSILSSRAYPSLGEFMASSTAGTENGARSTENGEGRTEDGEVAASTILMSESTTGASGSIAAKSSVAASSSAILRSSFSVLRTPTAAFHVLTADTDASREQGLTGHAPLAADQGMLFVFPAPGVYGFWMKGMLFPLDMVWVRADKTVAGVTPDIPPDSYPNIFFPPSDIQYVIELNAGAAKRSGIATSTQLSF